MIRYAFPLLLALSLATACTDDDTDPSDDTDIAETDDTDDTDNGEADLVEGKRIADERCAGCHEGAGGDAGGTTWESRVPSLSENQIKTVILNGQNYMPPIDVTDQEAGNVAAYVVDTFGS